ncbi:ASCH domain-containing protein [Leifsonia sp. NPDC058248]|uniref:ASCH domain-containing protein n=1 Tax=Leifsonia sp. NPDC058248 TaxID=3346402 RepID=UPI0036DA496D
MTELAPVDVPAAHEIWNEYAAAHPRATAGEGPPSVERFGDNPALCEQLLGLVLDGTKTATSSLVAEYEHEGAPLPRIGSHWIACDSRGRPRAILRSTELRLGTIDSVDADFASDEGEDDRSRDSWLVEHEKFWRRSCAAIGIAWERELPIVFERFDVVWTAPADEHPETD